MSSTTSPPTMGSPLGAPETSTLEGGGRPCDSITVMISTRDRADMLALCLDAIDVQEAPAGVDVEVLVVDNGSTDGTAELLTQWQQKSPRFPLRVVNEQIAGRSRALNTGVLAAEGDLIFLVDDDARPQEGWLRATWEGFQQNDADLVGGRLRPPPTFSPPDWFDPETMNGMLALLDWGDEPLELHEHFPYGANFAFRRDTARRLGGFDLRLGRTATSLLAGEEVEFARRVATTGGKVLYWPGSVCEHEVASWRLERDYFRRWKFMAGRSLYHMLYPAALPHIGPFPRTVVGKLLKNAVNWFMATVTFRRERAYAHELKLRGSAGTLYEAAVGKRATGEQPRLLEVPQPRVSAVIPAHNAEDTIEEALRSALEGEHPPDEILVVDDRSTDRTAEIARAFAPAVRVLESRGPGPSAARNTGIEAATGDWVAFLDADDLWTPIRLRVQLETLALHPELALISSGCSTFVPGGKEWRSRRNPPESGQAGYFMDRLLRENYVATSTVLARRDAVLEVGGFDEARDRAEDYDLWLKLVAHHPTAYVEGPGGRRRLRPGSLSSDVAGMLAAFEALREHHLSLQPWPESRKRAVRRSSELSLEFERAWVALENGDAPAARRGLLRFLAARPWNGLAWRMLLLALLPDSTRPKARAAASWLRETLMG